MGKKVGRRATIFMEEIDVVTLTLRRALHMPLHEICSCLKRFWIPIHYVVYAIFGAV